MVTGLSGNSGRISPAISRKRPAFTISWKSIRFANPCSSSRAVISSTAATVVPTATKGGRVSAAGPSRNASTLQTGTISPTFGCPSASISSMCRR